MNSSEMSGAMTAASGQKTLGRDFSLDARSLGEVPAIDYSMTSKSAPRASSFANSFS